MLPVLRHNMTDAIKVPSEGRSGGEERMERGAHAPNSHGKPLRCKLTCMKFSPNNGMAYMFFTKQKNVWQLSDL